MVIRPCRDFVDHREVGPRPEAQPEVVWPAASLHDLVAEAGLPIAELVLNNSGRQERDFAVGVDQRVVFDGMAPLLAVIEGLLDFGIIGVLDRPFHTFVKAELDRIVGQVQVVGFPRRTGTSAARAWLRQACKRWIH